MNRITIGEIVKAVGGTLLQEGEKQYIEGVRHDSRECETGDLFVAIIGENLDGHRYVDQAVQNGCSALLISDDRAGLEAELIRLCDESKLNLILTTGGTGLSPRDNAPEATLNVSDRQVPGIAEYMRAKSFEITPKAMLSRGVAAMRGSSLIINLPGSPKAVRESLEYIVDSLAHGIEILTGEATDCARK